ncbi:hypothetical protein HWV62_41336 [Athelia sp. TMB]|nr:hypothetical protein HWV62_41336 [Athelia sp. TMB]
MSSVSSFEIVDSPLDIIPDAPRVLSSPPESAKASEAIATSDLRDAPKKQDPEFYMQDDMLVLAVEDYLYRVPRFFLNRETSYFADKTGCMDRPAILNGVNRAEFNTLLSFLINTKYDPVALSFQEWLAILSASTHFGMKSVRARAVTELSTLRCAIDPVEQISIAFRHQIPAWLTDAYISLCARETPLTPKEVKTLGSDISCMVMEAREATIRAHFDQVCDSCSTQQKVLAEAARSAVDEVFGREERESNKLKLAKEQAVAKQEKERLRVKREKEESENKRKLKEAQAAKEKAEALIKEMEKKEKTAGSTDHPAPSVKTIIQPKSGAKR